jgi:transposase
MINYSELRIFVCTTPTRMSYSFDRLAAMAEKIFAQDPLLGHLFLFLNRRRDRVKILYWDEDGYCIWYKRLEAGTFQLPRATRGEQAIELEYYQLDRMLGGLDLRTGRRRKRYRRVT